MKRTRILMGMPITVDVIDVKVKETDIAGIFDYFAYVDRTFSPYKKDSEISRLNSGEITKKQVGTDVRQILQLADDTKKESNGYFNIVHKGQIDPSGIVKGWAIYNAASLLREHGFQHFYIDAGGDIQVSGKNEKGENWTVGIKNPFKQDEIVKVVKLDNKGIATSGLYIRGEHIYNPHNPEAPITGIASMTIIGPTVYDADRFATAAFAMGEKGIQFIEKLPGYDGYMIDSKGIATMTSRFERFVVDE
ncbi:MAG TPA: FAD:protein FMN transferase [Candidatus Saccharimonadales bacterium]|nr:FAD:protein FMN transferase [Candidatus Saccharimonadales bacterium]